MSIAFAMLFPDNFRLTRLLTTRNVVYILKDINYTYDAVGNIVETYDHADKVHYFNNAAIQPQSLYWYDALYRLVKAKGREKDSISSAPSNADLAATIPIPYTGANNFANYNHFYSYDKLGNILQMKNGNDQVRWNRQYYYDTTTPNQNRLVSHDNVNQAIQYTYDTHGNMTQMPGIQIMEWDFANQLHRVSVTDDQNSTKDAYYNYDLGGERVRKVIEKTNENIREERIYFGNFEVYRKYVNNVKETERRTLHISDGQKNIAFIDTLTLKKDGQNNIVAVLEDTIRWNIYIC